ncbi:MAG: C4-dicarboxylate-specific signal transduction histidine kinase [Myxococcota bacterium]|jgi:C4-dicarboxylate-specific signal transduction histidine kinase
METVPTFISRDVIDKGQEALLRLMLTGFGLFLLSWALGNMALGEAVVHPGVPTAAGLVCLLAAFSVGRILPCKAATLGCTAVMVALVSRATVTGGLASPMMLWLAVPPFLAITLGGTRSTRPMLIVAVAAILVLLLAHHLKGLSSHDNTLHIRLAISHVGLSGFLIFTARHTRSRHRTSLRVAEDANRALKVEVMGHEKTRANLDTTYGEMLHIARKAGMGEVAIGVLHNVGNALNGVNTSVALAVIAVERTDVSLARVATLLEGDLDKQHKVAAYLRRLDVSMAGRRGHLREELDRIRLAAEHVAAIVQAQQRLATTGGVIEVVQVADLLAQSRLLLDASLKRHEIVLNEDLPDVLRLSTDRHRVIQILTNLIGNARDALRNAKGERTIRIRCRRIGSDVRFDVRDTGDGVPQDFRARIFTHGFTTKKDGHGFGLHSSALAARDIGGRLTLEPSTEGAHFCLVVPVEPSNMSTSPHLSMRESFTAQIG